APLVRSLQKCWIPRAFSVIAVVLLAFMALFAIGGTIALEATQLAGDLPRYKSTLDAKISAPPTAIATGGPTLLMLLALGTFVAGVHVSWCSRYHYGAPRAGHCLAHTVCSLIVLKSCGGHRDWHDVLVAPERSAYF